MPAVIDPTTYLSRADVAKELGVGVARVDQLAAKGRIEFVATPLGRLFDPEVVERFAEQRKRSSAG